MRTRRMRRIRLGAAAVVVSHPCDSTAIDEKVWAALGLHRPVTVSIADAVDRLAVYKNIWTAFYGNSAAGVRISDPDNSWHDISSYGFTRK